MSEVLQANIFFFITGIAVIVFSLLLCIALYHFIKILKSVRNVVERIEAGTEVIAEDMSNMRDYFAEGTFFSHLVGMVVGKSPFDMFRKKGEAAEKKKPKKARSKKSHTKLKIKGED